MITIKSLVRRAPGTISDNNGGVPGLRLETGKTSRTFRISPRINGKQYNIKVASCTATADDLEEAGRQLTAAREKARQILADAKNGITPEVRAEVDAENERREARRAQKLRQETFGFVFDEYMRMSGNACADASERWRKYRKELEPHFGDVPIRDITRADVKALLLAKHERFQTEARRLRALVTKIFNYALKEGYVDVSVAAQIDLPSKEVKRKRHLKDHEIVSFWRGLDGAAMLSQTKLILKMVLVTGQRRGEVTAMHWSEIDPDKGWWDIPETKAGRPTRVPLSDLAWSLIHATGTTEGYVFAKANGAPPVVNSVSQAMLRELPTLGLAGDPARPHDLRRTVASCMGDLGINRTIISKILNHKQEGVTGEIYDLSDRYPQKKLAMDAWANRLRELITSQPAPSNVVPLEKQS